MADHGLNRTDGTGLFPGPGLSPDLAQGFDFGAIAHGRAGGMRLNKAKRPAKPGFL
jgi:hypothetical protein